MKTLLVTLLLLALAVPTPAALKTGPVIYNHGDTMLEGYLAWDDSFPGKRPGVLVIHDWRGVGPFVKGIADRLAGMGYVALAPDIYGKGVRPANADQAAAQAGIYRSDRPLLRARANAGLDVLLRHELVDPARVAVMGYCFGGGAALELARSGAPMAGVISFHGNLDTPKPADTKNIRGKVLVLHGADDPNLPPAQLTAFEEEMRGAKADWQLILYGGAVHAFTNPGAGNDPAKGAAYNEKADRRSWEALKLFFGEIFK